MERSLGLQVGALLLWHRSLSYSRDRCFGIRAPPVGRDVRNCRTWRDYEQPGRALGGRGIPGGQAWIKKNVKKGEGLTHPDGGFVVMKQKFKLCANETFLFGPQGYTHNRIYPAS